MAAVPRLLVPLTMSAITAVAIVAWHRRQRNASECPKRGLLKGSRRVLTRGTVTVAYCSCTGTCAGLARRLCDELQRNNTASGVMVQLVEVSERDWWDELVNYEQEDHAGSVVAPVLVLVLPTWTHGTLPPHAQGLMHSLRDIQNDWRVAPEPLKQTHLRVAVFGMGSSAYDAETVGKPAKEAFSCLVDKLGAQPLVQLKHCHTDTDSNTTTTTTTTTNNNNSSKKLRKSSRKFSKTQRNLNLMIGDAEVGDYNILFDKWMNAVVASIFYPMSLDNNLKEKKYVTESHCVCSQTETKEMDGVVCCSSEQKTNDMDENDLSTESISEEEEDSNDDEDDIVDVEDMGNILNSQITGFTPSEPAEMVTPKQAKALKKEGYKLIGTHSAVKLCRWTKHQLRGRGGCYKHTHYGITSYQCMEATPSLACANKCVFCWRHHKNPVGREWRWKTDDPKMIVEEALKTHVKMIKETRGIPGIQMDRWEEAHRVRHCALSLVGEPIMYPHINELLRELHQRKISTFLVTNGQHPQAIHNLIPITQLYVSVDASTPESLEAIDRPLFRDAWERLKSSLSCLKGKGQRTVARLTVVKGWNSNDIGGYARLMALGHCSFIEVKGVTFCGKSEASNLNMTNTPWHHEVVEFSQTLLRELNALRQEQQQQLEDEVVKGKKSDLLPEYDLACEHKHSCSVLLARVDQFAIPDPEDPSRRKWKTWIDYDKFQELSEKHTVDPSFTFRVEDYVAETPSWALFGANEEGFDPTDNRHRRKKKHPKYTRFDASGVPTHDSFGEPLGTDEISNLKVMMENKMRELNNTELVTALQSGEIRIEDASLMFRGLVVER